MGSVRHRRWLVPLGCLAAVGAVESARRIVGTTEPAARADEPARSAPVPPPESDSGTSEVTPAPALAEPSPEWQAEKAWAEARGVVIEPDVTTVVAKRRGRLARSETYEDTIVVFRPDRTLVRFVGTTKPAQMPSATSAVVPDVDQDGRKDLGMVRPGVYRAIGDATFGLPGHRRTAFKIVTEDGDAHLPAWRDLSGDGVFSPWERKISEQRGYTIDGIYIHYGFAPTGTTIGERTHVGPWSVGCQNVLYDELDDFVAAVGGADASFRYAIVDE